MGFKQSKVNECVYYREKKILLINFDDDIIWWPSATEIQGELDELAILFDRTNEGEIDAYLGVHIRRTSSHAIKLTQPHLIRQILDEIGMKDNSKLKDKYAPSLTIFHRELEGGTFREKWDYRSIIGNLSLLEKSTRPEIAYETNDMI